MSYINLEELGFKDGAGLDAFHRLRASQVTTLFDAQLQYGLGSRDWQSATTGAGSQTHLPNESAVQLSTGGSTDGDGVIRQTRLCWRYQSGKSQLYFQTFLFGAAEPNVVRRVGYFNEDDGVFLEQNDTDLRVVNRSSVSGSSTDAAYAAQVSWNRDKLDGTGSSGKILDITKTQLMFLDLQWLGAGRVRVGFFIDGVPIIAHEFYHGNVLTTAYMKTANLPARGEIFNVGTSGGAATMKMICTSIMAEGGDDDFQAGHLNSASNGSSPVSVTSRRPVLSIRPAAMFGGVTNYAWYVLIDLIVRTVTNDVYWEVVYGGSLTGASWTAAAADSCVEWDSSATGITGGVSVLKGYSIAGLGSSGGAAIAKIAGRFPNSVSSLDGSQPSHTLVATSMSGSANVAVATNWREIY